MTDNLKLGKKSARRKRSARTGAAPLELMFKPNEIFVKTPEGKHEMLIHHRPMDVSVGSDLTFVERRILILIDGIKSVAQLRSFTTPEEFDSVIKSLLDKKFIINKDDLPAHAKLALPAPAAQQKPAEHVNPQSFEWIQAEAIRFLRETVGDSSVPMCAALAKATNMSELKKLMKGIVIFVEQRMDREITVKLARHFNAMVLLAPFGK